MIEVKKPKVNFLSNREFLVELGKSKSTFCSYMEPWQASPDHIVGSIEELTEALFLDVRVEKARVASPKGRKAVKIIPEDIPLNTVVIRVMTNDHVPEEIVNRKRGSTTDNLLFPPFKHYVWEDGAVEVLRSHWVGGLLNGYFSQDHGKTTPRLAQMWMKLVHRYAMKGNFRGYSYNEDMQCEALMQMCQVGLQFNEYKSQNPFAFYTQVINNVFIRVLNREKRVHNLRDDLLEIAGANPSHARQGKND